MKNLKEQQVIIKFFCILFLFISCEEPEEPAPKPIPPTASFMPAPIYINHTYTVAVPHDTMYQIRFRAQPGNNPLESLSVEIGNGPLDISLLSLENNPFTLTGRDKEGFTKVITITNRGFNNRQETYRIVVKDEAGKEVEISFQIISYTLRIEEGTLLNFHNNPTDGALNLYTGESMSTYIPSRGPSEPVYPAMILDVGIDSTAPPESNWRGQIAGFNGWSLKAAAPGVDFDSISTLQDARMVFRDPAAVPLEVSERVEVGDIFAVSQPGAAFFVLRAKEVNPTPDDDMDNIVFEIKFSPY